jgi:hypothetical protein
MTRPTPNWRTRIAIFYLAGWAVAALFPELFPKRKATILFLIPILVVSMFFLLMQAGGIVFPLIALFTRGKKAFEYEWHVWWSLK